MNDVLLFLGVVALGVGTTAVVSVVSMQVIAAFQGRRRTVRLPNDSGIPRFP